MIKLTTRQDWRATLGGASRAAMTLVSSGMSCAGSRSAEGTNLGRARRMQEGKRAHTDGRKQAN